MRLTMEKTTGILALRLAGAVAASAAFGLIATQTRAWDTLPLAVGLGFLFGTGFIGGTGYRIIIAAATGRQEQAPASWSGATAGAALLTLALWLVLVMSGKDGGPALLGFGIGINIAYLLAKFACLSAGCCHAEPGHGLRADLRVTEIAGTVLVLGAAALLALTHTGLAATVAIGGHLLVRLVSRWMRGRWSWGWPPLRQPGAEIAPLVVLLAVSLASLTAH